MVRGNTIGKDSYWKLGAGADNFVLIVILYQNPSIKNGYVKYQEKIEENLLWIQRLAKEFFIP